MKLLSTGVLMAFCGLLFLPAAETKQKPSDRDQIQGTWSVVSAQDKNPDGPKDFKLVKFSFKGDRIAIKIMGKDKVGRFKLDTAKNPKEINITIKGLKKIKHKEKGEIVIEAEQVSRGIYQLQGDTLKICMGDLGQARPEKFAAIQEFECRCTVLKLKRDKK